MGNLGHSEVQRGLDGGIESFQLIDGPVNVGRGSSCFIQLNSQSIGSSHIILRPMGTKLEVSCLHRNGVVAGGDTLMMGDQTTVSPGEAIELADFRLCWRRSAPADTDNPNAGSDNHEQTDYEDYIRSVHTAAVDELHQMAARPARHAVESLVRELLRGDGLKPKDYAEKVAVRRWLLDALTDRILLTTGPAEVSDERFSQLVEGMAKRLELELGPRSITADLDKVRVGAESLGDELWPNLVLGLRHAIACEPLSHPHLFS